MSLLKAWSNAVQLASESSRKAVIKAFMNMLKKILFFIFNNNGLTFGERQMKVKRPIKMPKTHTILVIISNTLASSMIFLNLSKDWPASLSIIF